MDEPDPMKGKGARLRQQRRGRLLRALLKLDKSLPRDIEAIMAAARAYRGVDLTRETVAQLRQRLLELLAASSEFGPRSMLANTAAAVWHDLLETLVKKVAPAEAPALASDLVAGSGQLVSAEHGYRLLDLAAAAAADPAARALVETGPLDPARWRQLPPDSPFRRELERFLHDFGHRAVYEVEIAHPRWVEDPTFLLEQVRLILQSGMPAGFRDAGAQRRQQALRAIGRRAWLLLPLIRWAARRASRAAALREGAKSALVAILEPCRRIILEVARRMQAAGVLDDPEDVFYLTWLDLAAYLDGWWDGTGAKALVHDRKAQRAAWLAQEPPDVIMDPGAAFAPGAGPAAGPARPENGKAQAAQGPNTLVLTGTAVSAGIATGRVRVLRHPSEGSKLAPGEILVAPSTDPGWTPLFMRAAAIVMEVGGYHSHGAIVAREFGIPAVVNVPGVLATLRDGDTVTVNGNEGTVVRH